MDGITFAIAFSITANTGINSGPGPARILQDEALIGHDYALGWIILQNVALQWEIEFDRNLVGLDDKNWKFARADKF